MGLGRTALAPLALVLGLSFAAGCGGSATTTAFTPVAGTESPYCDAYRAWQVHQLDGGGSDPQRSPAAFRRYWNEYLVFEETLLREAPPEIREAVTTKVTALRTLITPLLERYAFDLALLRREGTDAQRALAEGLPPLAARAENLQHAYDDRVCGVASPPPADVAFERDASSQAYCAALSSLNSRFEQAHVARFDPAAARSLFAGDGFEASLDAVEEAAPPAIAADVEAEIDWMRTRWRDVFAAFGFDIRRVWQEGTPEDRAVLTKMHPEVVRHAARTTAYEDQVCAGG